VRQDALAEQAIGDGDDAAHGGVRAAQFLHADAVGDVVTAEAAVLLRDGQAEEPQLAELADDRGIDGLAAVPLSPVRDYLLVEELAGSLLEPELVFGQGKVHAAASLVIPVLTPVTVPIMTATTRTRVA
jgi:hypothetical protein